MQMNKLMKKTALRLSVYTGLTLSLGMTMAAQAQTLDEALRSAQAYVPALASQQSLVDAAEARIRVAKSARLPQVSLTANFTAAEYDNNATRARGASSFERVDSDRVDLVVTQRLLDFDRTTSQVKEAKYVSESERSALDLVHENLTIQVVAAYLDVLRYQELDRVAEQNVRNGKDLASIVDKQVQQGRSADVEKNLAQSQLAVTQAQRHRQAGLLAESRAQFYELTGLMPTNLEALPKLNGVDVLYSERDPNRINASLADSPRIQVANNELLAAKSGRKAESASRYPTLDLEFFAGQGNDENAVLGENDGYGASLNLNWDLYAGGGNNARVRAASAEYASAESNLLEEYRLARQQILIAVESLSATEAELEYLRIEEEANKNVFTTYQQQLTSGRRSPIDVFVVLNNYNQSRLQLTDALYRKQLEEYTILSIYGSLSGLLGL